MADPYELRNLVGLETHVEVTKVLRERLLRRMSEIEEAAPTIKSSEPDPELYFDTVRQFQITPEETQA